MSDHFGQRKEDKKAIRRSRSSERATDTGASAHPLLQLQRRIGNAQVARMLQRQAEEEEPLQARRDPALQRQPEEEEPLQARRDPALQRHDEEALQPKRDGAPEVGLEGGPVTEATEQRIQSARGGGSPLDGATRTQMEGAFNADFSDVRVHSGAESAALNRSVGAQAFTTGSDIFFGQNASPSNSNLLAHELTHVVQQRSMTPSGGPLTVTAAGDQNEQAADSMAAAVTSSPPTAQRKDDEG